jgi:hypothetical protein
LTNYFLYVISIKQGEEKINNNLLTNNGGSVMSDTWGVDQEFSYDEGSGDGRDTAGVRINGMVMPVEPGTSFKEAIKNISLEAGFGKYRVFLNGAEIKPSEAPTVFESGMIAELKLYDIAG